MPSSLAIPEHLRAINPHLPAAARTPAKTSKRPKRSKPASVLTYTHRWEGTALVVTITGLRTEKGQNARENRFVVKNRVAAEKRAVRMAMLSTVGTYSALRARLPSMLPYPVVVTVIRCAPSGGLDEHDNLRGALKALVDAVADWLELPSDRDKRVTWAYDQIDTRAEACRATWAGQWGIELRFERRPEGAR